MLLPITTIIELLLKNRKWLWISPIFLFVLIFISRLSAVFFNDSVINYFSNIVCVCIGCIILISILITVVNYIFDTQNRWCEEISSFHSIGYGFYLQIIFRILVIMFFVFVSSVMFMFISELLPLKLLLLIPPLVCSFIFFRLLGLWLGFYAVSYLPIIFLLVSFFYPVYILPSPVFVMQGSIFAVSSYILMYSVLYLLVDMKLSYYTWREICISWIY